MTNDRSPVRPAFPPSFTGIRSYLRSLTPTGAPIPHAEASNRLFREVFARSAILRFFHLRGATVERVGKLPPAVERSQAGGLGKPLSRAEAEQRVGFGLALPPVEGGGPARVYVLGYNSGHVAQKPVSNSRVMPWTA